MRACDSLFVQEYEVLNVSFDLPELEVFPDSLPLCGPRPSNRSLPVWGHERVMVYGKMISEFMVPDVYANDPIEVRRKGGSTRDNNSSTASERE